MTTRHRTAWTFAITSAALFMASLDNLVVTTALPSIRDHLHASLEGLQWTVNAYTLTFAVLLLTGATLGERYGRRRLFVIGLGIFTAGSAAAALAPGIGTLIAARAVQGVGAAILVPLTLTLLSGAARAGPGCLGRGRRAGHRYWPAGRRGRGRRRVLAVDLLAERSHRHRAAAGRLGAADREPRIRVPAGPARRDPGERGTARHRARRGARQRPRLDQPDRVAAGRGRRPARGGVPGLGDAGPRANAPAAAVPQPRVHRDQRGLAADVLRDVRLDLLAGAVPAGRPGLQPARGRHPHAPVDRDAGARRPGRGLAVGPDRRPAAAGDRARPAGDRPWLAGRGRQPDRGLRHPGARVRGLRRRHVAVLRPCRQRGPRLGAARGGGHRLRREQRHP